MMKNYLKILILLFLFTNISILHAQCESWDADCNDSPITPPDPTETPSEGTGGRKTPIDGYLPLLIITAVTIAGIYSYKQRKLIQK